jgi:predicted nucleic acid-binding protein
LVSGGTAATLDDGEAATIAYAAENRMAAVIDERKAHRICQSQYPNLLVGSTMDLLALDAVEKALGRVGLVDAVHRALVGARMRVAPKYLEWTINLVGEERALLCDSLPRRLRKKTTKTTTNS